MKCDNCNAYNAHVIKLHYGDEEERHVLCSRCYKLLIQLNDEFTSTLYDEHLDGQTSSGHKSF